MRECVRSGRDVIPSPHRLFDCGGGVCDSGALAGRVIDVLNWDEMEDVDQASEAFGIKCNYTGDVRLGKLPAFGLPYRYSMFSVDHSDELVIKAELFLFGNPVLAILEPDMKMMSYSTRAKKYRQPAIPLPVYHITGAPLRPHVVVVLGWGSEPEPHWVIQNSWGDAWGDRGRGLIALDDLTGAAVVDYRVWRSNWAAVVSVVFFVLVVVIEFGPEVRWFCRRVCKRGMGLKEKVDDDDGERCEVVV